MVIDFFNSHKDISGIVHFVASKAVGESVEKPLLYYENNLNPLIYILQELQYKSFSYFIFSSSCRVYDQSDSLPIAESVPIKQAESSYSNTKQIEKPL